ncbi:MAG: peptidase S41 [Gammaproteobacteria bacterium]|nr:peptidase S41 [Gammaproteobacteria bacterium]
MIVQRLMLSTILLFVSVYSLASDRTGNELSVEEKIYGLSVLWKEASYNFAYFDQVENLDWDAEYLKYIPKVKASKNDFEYYRLLSELAAKLEDGMTYIKIPESLIRQHIAFPAIKIAEAEGKAVIVAVEKSLHDLIPIGSVILKVDGKSVEQILKTDVFPYISSSTQHIKLDNAIKGSFINGYGLLAGAPKSKVNITLKLQDKSEKIVELTRDYQDQSLEFISSEHVAKKQQERELSIVGRELENGIYYLALNNFSDLEMVEKFKTLIPDMQKSTGLILDLRYNEGGNTMIVEDILKYLTFHDLTGAKSKMRIHNATFKAWGKFAQEYQWAKKYEDYYVGQAWTEMPADVLYADDVPRSDKVVVPTAVLIGRNTSSAAENFLIYTDGAEQFHTIGERTFGSTGQPLIIDLPGGGKAKICTKRDSYADGRDFVGYGIKPDILVPRDVSYYLSNDDAVLNVAEKFLNELRESKSSDKVAKLMSNNR